MASSKHVKPNRFHMKLPRGARNESHLLFCWTLYFYATDECPSANHSVFGSACLRPVEVSENLFLYWVGGGKGHVSWIPPRVLHGFVHPGNILRHFDWMHEMHFNLVRVPGLSDPAPCRIAACTDG